MGFKFQVSSSHRYTPVSVTHRGLQFEGMSYLTIVWNKVKETPSISHSRDLTIVWRNKLSG